MESSTEPLPPQVEPLPSISYHGIEYHDGKGYYYRPSSKDFLVSSGIRTLKCVREKCKATAQMGEQLSSLKYKNRHYHQPDFLYREKCLVLQTIREQFLSDKVPAALVLQNRN